MIQSIVSYLLCLVIGFEIGIIIKRIQVRNYFKTIDAKMDRLKELREKFDAKTITDKEKTEMLETCFNVEGRLDAIKALKKIL